MCVLKWFYLPSEGHGQGYRMMYGNLIFSVKSIDPIGPELTV